MTHLGIAAVLAAAMIAATPAAADNGTGGSETRPLDATRTGVEQVDENRVPDSVRDGLEEFRRQSAEHRDAALEAARKIMVDLETAAADAGEKLSVMGDEAAREWKEISAAFEDNLKQAQDRLDELQSAAAEQWDETRAAVAEALEKAANSLQKKKS